MCSKNVQQNAFEKPDSGGAIDVSKLEEPRGLEDVIATKKKLINLINRELCNIISLPSKSCGYKFHRQWATAFELLCEHIIRDDSPISLSGVNGIQTTLDQVCRGVSLREGINITPLETVSQDVVKSIHKFKEVQDPYRKYIQSLTDKDPRPIRIWSGESDKFTKYGKITGLRLGEDGIYEAGRIIMPLRPQFIYMEDYHSKTPELLVPDGPSILQVVTTEDDREEYFNGELFYIQKGVPVYINKGIRHFAPLPLYSGVITSPVIFRLATTTDGKDFHHTKFHYKRRIL